MLFPGADLSNKYQELGSRIGTVVSRGGLRINFVSMDLNVKSVGLGNTMYTPLLRLSS